MFVALRLLALGLWLLPALVLTLLLWTGRCLRWWGLPCHLEVARWWYRGALAVLGVRVWRQGPTLPNGVQLVSNHISWLDILVIGSQTGCCFVSKSEVRGWPIVGWLAASVGTVFLRRGQGDTDGVLNAMARPIAAGASVLFFPEGTTTKGDGVRRFHRRLFALAAQSALPVQPLAVRYRHAVQPHPVVPYVDQQRLWDNLLGLLAWSGPIDVDLLVLPTIQSSSRNELANLSQQAVSHALFHWPQ